MAADQVSLAEAARTVFHRMPFPAVLTDDNRRYLDVNTAFTEFTKYDRDALIGRRVDGLVGEPMASTLVHRWDMLTVLRARTSTTVVLLADGSTVNVRYTAVRDVQPGQHLGVLFPEASVAQPEAWSETTAQGGLAKAARLRDFFQTTVVPMFLTDADRLVVDANAAATTLLGLPLQELLQLQVDDLWRGETGSALMREWHHFDGEGSRVGDVVVEPRGILVRYVVIANVLAGRHLGILFRQAAPSGHGPLLLTEREREVLGLVALGESLASIADRLALSHGTVRDHARAARAKLGARTLAQATAIAVRDGHIQT
jgi:PAS domain S-box-containing protein